MRSRTLILAALAVAVAATSPAVAAPRRAPVKVCNLMTDAKGDGTWNFGAGVVTSPALDIHSADIATGRNELVAVLRIQTLDTANDNWRKALGYEWAFGANGSGTRYEFKMRRGIGPNPTDIWEVTVGDTRPKFTSQIVGNTLVWRLQRKDVPALNRAKLFWTDFGANTKALSSTADNASNPNSKYNDKAPSCVVAK